MGKKATTQAGLLQSLRIRGSKNRHSAGRHKKIVLLSDFATALQRRLKKSGLANGLLVCIIIELSVKVIYKKNRGERALMV
jgi:hypothetical protein